MFETTERPAAELETINGVDVTWSSQYGPMWVKSESEALKVLAGRTCIVAICWRDQKNPELAHLIPPGERFSRTRVSESFIWTPLRFQNFLVNSTVKAGESFWRGTKTEEGIAA